MTDKLEETIKDIAARHGIAVGHDDPLLMLHTMNERLINDSAAAQRELLDGFASQVEAVAARWEIDAKGKADQALAASLADARTQIARTMEDCGKSQREAMRREIDATVSRVEKAVGSARAVSLLNLAAGLMVVCASGLVVFAVA